MELAMKRNASPVAKRTFVAFVGRTTLPNLAQTEPGSSERRTGLPAGRCGILFHSLPQFSWGCFAFLSNSIQGSRFVKGRARV